MSQHQKKRKIVGILLIFTLMILTGMSVFPSPVLAQDEVWECPDVPIVLSMFETPPQYISDVGLHEVKNLVLGVIPPGPGGIGDLTVDLGFEQVHLSWFGFWSSDTHGISVMPGTPGNSDIIEVTFDPPIIEVGQVWLSNFLFFPEEIAVVEMLQLVFSTEEDFGDAPDPTYPTLLASDGARHQISPLLSLFLGAGLDNELDGQPNANATGDDIGFDDEDGVAFTTPLIPGNTANVSVVAFPAGLLDA